MAKVGEGDSRWIVSDRKDGTNCNAWHWEEKDLTQATKDGLKAAFKDLSLVSNDAMTLKVKEASEVNGEVTVAQRKGKIMCYFELKVNLKYTGSVADSEDSVDGKVEIPEVDHDCFNDDFEVRVATTEGNKAATQAESWVRKDGRPIIRKVISDYINDLFTTYQVGKNLKQLQQQAAGGATTTTTTSAPKPATQAPVAPKPEAPKPAPAAASPSSFDWKIQWRCPAEDLWTVLTDQGRASAYTRAPAKIDPRNGGTFEFLGGTISGYYVEVEHPKKITMQWRLSSWKSGVFSTVAMILETEERGVTNLQFAQRGIPEGELDRVKQGWTVNFWEPIKMMFGFPMEWK